VVFGKDQSDWAEGETVGEQLAAEIVSEWFNLHPDQPSYDLCDPLTMAGVIEPGLFKYTHAQVTVATSGPRTGEARAVFGAGPVKMATGVDVDAAHALVLDRLKTPEA
jgi:inosine-uridine nucleoside N-ribohydrolase